MKKHSVSLLTLSIVLFTLTPITFAGSIITVDDDGPADFDTIQAAIDVNEDGILNENYAYFRKFTLFRLFFTKIQKFWKKTVTKPVFTGLC